MPRRKLNSTPKDQEQDVKSKKLDVWRFAQSLPRILTTFFVAALTKQACELCLTPVYGSIPSTLNIDVIIILVWALSYLLIRLDLVAVTGYCSYLLCLIPIVQSVLFRFSGTLGPLWGPYITCAFTSFPAIYNACASILDIILEENYRNIIDGALSLVEDIPVIDNARRLPITRSLVSISVQIASGLLLGYLASFTWDACEYLVALMISWSGHGPAIFSSRHGLQAIITVLWAALLRSRGTFALSFMSLIYVTCLSPHLPMPYNTALVNSTLHTAGYSLIARQESLTGYISVLDNLKEGYRVMRCDHSLLGGEWINKPQGHPAIFNEPIYSIFVMLEAVRLVEPELDFKEPGPDFSTDRKEALVIGLGVGTAPAALIAHGVATTTVEIDPVVHDFATRYFNLPHDHTSIIGDAVQVVHDFHAADAERKFHYIIHDVFTGGAEPIELFTYEFLTDLSNLLKSDGTIAINYAGDLLLPSARAVIAQVLAVFPTCRLFRESPQPIPLGSEDFTNLVMFCQKSVLGFKFRKPVEADFLGSPARRQHLVPQNEITEFRGRVILRRKIIRRGHTDVFEANQLSTARGHWHVMRKVLPDIVWENW